MAFVSEKKRSHTCGSLGVELDGQTVVLMGWVNNRRDHGGLVFVDLRDRDGLVQIVLDPGKEATAVSKKFRNEFVIAIEGVVRKRPEGMINDKMKTGAVEVEVTSTEILSEAETPPFVIDDPKVSEAVRLKYRYLALRSTRLQECLRLRHEITKVVRDFLSEEGFWEVETPILYKSTPEGARDYLVPSRVNQGQFYALPQSPQTLKQLLMVGGTDRYFQIARCFRDEDLRADRQPEFSQIDLEMSFVDEDDVRAMNEKMLRTIWKKIKNVEVGEILQIDYQVAMDKYGSDKPDLRNPMEIIECSDLVKGFGFKVFDSCIESGGVVRALGLQTQDTVSRSQIDKWIKLIKPEGAGGIVWIKKEGDEYQSPVNKFLSQDLLKSIYERVCPEGFGTVLMVSDTKTVVSRALGLLRNTIGEQFDLIDKSKDVFCWVVNFPLLDYDDKEKRWVACHHPFTMTKDDHVNLLKTGENSELGQIQAKAYDLVCNGNELAGGSIRIHDQEVQSAMFRALGLSEEQAKYKFGYFVEALSYGTPPHGGIAWGLDRLSMILAGTDAIRDVIAFPKTAKAQDLMADSPSDVDRHQLLELGIKINKPTNES
ncbi:MAG: aspartate--tRNA ligase [Bdellovibrionales bacterium]|nr:aspartate--tRNA ligase [Bdellovibrionales bacterium]NQZ18176.1 aspartate--tRNA ligase [Bdellovibrionales bacterium]